MPTGPIIYLFFFRYFFVLLCLYWCIEKFIYNRLHNLSRSIIQGLLSCLPISLEESCCVNLLLTKLGKQRAHV